MRGLKRTLQFLVAAAIGNLVVFCLNAKAQNFNLMGINLVCILALVVMLIRISDLIEKTKVIENGPHRRAYPEIHSDPVERAAVGAPNESGGAAIPSRPIFSGPFGGARPTGGTVERAGIVLGEVLAYRCWQLAGDFILSLNGAVWIPGEPMIGVNVDIENSNGVHAFKDIDDARKYSTDREMVIGVVKLWGTIIEHETGYRAEFAKPIEFIEPAKQVDVLWLHYGLDQR